MLQEQRGGASMRACGRVAPQRDRLQSGHDDFAKIDQGTTQTQLHLTITATELRDKYVDQLLLLQFGDDDDRRPPRSPSDIVIDVAEQIAGDPWPRTGVYAGASARCRELAPVKRATNVPGVPSFSRTPAGRDRPRTIGRAHIRAHRTR